MIDYLEGFLIGSIWSDTDYRTRRHYHAHVFLAALMGAAFALFHFFPDSISKWVVVPWPLSLVLLIILLLATPIISSIYYRIPFFIRPLLLLLYVMKYVLLFYTLVHFFFPLITLDQGEVPALLLSRIDDRMTRSLDRHSASGSVLTTVAGVLVGAFWIIAEGLVVILVLIVVPLIAIALLKGIRYVLDFGLYELIDRYFLKRRPATADDIPWLGTIEREGETIPNGNKTMPIPEFAEQQKETVVIEKDSDDSHDGGEHTKTHLTDRLRFMRDGIREAILRKKKAFDRARLEREQKKRLDGEQETGE